MDNEVEVDNSSAMSSSCVRRKISPILHEYIIEQRRISNRLPIPEANLAQVAPKSHNKLPKCCLMM